MAGGPVVAPAVAAASGGPGSDTSTSEFAAVDQAGSSRVVLGLGSQGALVSALQRRLNEILPFSHLAVDGIYGPLTRQAVTDFQRRDGLLADGTVDAGAWARMFDAPVLVFGSAGDASARSSAPATPGTVARPQVSRSHTEFASLHAKAVAPAPQAPRGVATAPASTSGTGAGTATGDTHVGGPAPAAPVSSSAGGGASASAPQVSVVTPAAPTSQPSTYVLTNGVALPLPRQYMVNGSVDQGVDYSAPGGTPEYAMGDGVIIGEGISGFGPNAPILKITSGPLAGLEVYYGHAGPDLVKVGQHVSTGQQISEVGYGIVGISTGPHLEIGFYPTGPTGAGSRMLSVINALLKQHPTGRAWGATGSAAAARDVKTREGRHALRERAQQLGRRRRTVSEREPPAVLGSEQQSGPGRGSGIESDDLDGVRPGHGERSRGNAFVKQRGRSPEQQLDEHREQLRPGAEHAGAHGQCHEHSGGAGRAGGGRHAARGAGGPSAHRPGRAGESAGGSGTGGASGPRGTRRSGQLGGRDDDRGGPGPDGDAQRRRGPGRRP